MVGELDSEVNFPMHALCSTCPPSCSIVVPRAYDNEARGLAVCDDSVVLFKGKSFEVLLNAAVDVGKA